MPKYQCIKCNYNTLSKISMYKHFSRIKKCSRNIDSLDYTDDEIIKYSLVPLSDRNKISKNINENKKYNIYKSVEEYIEELKDIYNNSRKKCNYCNKDFTKYKDLEYHLHECIYITKNLSNDNKNIIVDNSVNTINNTNTNTNIYNNNININIHLPNKSLVSFNDLWNIDHLDKNTKTLLFMSTVKYTKTLEYILKNDINKNVLLDEESKTGIVYKGDENSFEKMKLEDIIDESVEKIYNHLKEFHKELKDKNDIEFNLDNDSIKTNLKITETKFNDYNSDQKIKKNVSQIISSIYNQHKDDAKDIYKSISLHKDLKEIKF